MFILGLILGPAIGLLAGDVLARPPAGNKVLSLAAVVLIAFIFLFLPLVDLELRLGLVGGFLLGLTLSATPDSLAPVE